MRISATPIVAAVRGFIARDDGQDLLEYGLLLSLIVTFLMGSVNLVGKHINGVLWSAIAATRF